MQRGKCVETLNIAICEDMQSDAVVLRRMIRESGVDSQVFTYESGEAFLAAFQPGFFQLILLDIYYDAPPGTAPADAITGVDVALKIRETDADVWLAFTTVSPDQAIAGYKAKADRYLTKPLDAGEVTALLHRAAKYWESVDDEITVTVDRKPRGIRPRDILYIESHGKQSAIHTKDETVSTYTAINELEAMLSSPPFVRCHRSYIANMDYIQSAGRDFQMTNGDMVYIGRRGQWKMREIYRSYIARLAREELI